MIIDFKGDKDFAVVACKAFDLVDLDTGLPVPEPYMYADDDAGVYRGYVRRPGGTGPFRVFKLDPATRQPITFERRARLKFVPRPGRGREVAIVERILARHARLQQGAFI